MNWKDFFGYIFAGGAAGTINGLFGAGGGMVLIPLLSHFTKTNEDQLFPSSVTIMLPICIVSIFTNINHFGMPIKEAWPYLLGSVVGGLLAGYTENRIPVKWLHKIFGAILLWGGIRFLC